MKTLTIFFLLSLPSLTFAQKAQITILDPHIDAKPLEKDFDIHHGSTHKSSIPDKAERDRVLGVSKKTKNWDQLKKDIFFMDLQKKPFSEMREKYPEFSESDLKALKARL